MKMNFERNMSSNFQLLSEMIGRAPNVQERDALVFGHLATMFAMRPENVQEFLAYLKNFPPEMTPEDEKNL